MFAWSWFKLSYENDESAFWFDCCLSIRKCITVTCWLSAYIYCISLACHLFRIKIKDLQYASLHIVANLYWASLSLSKEKNINNGPDIHVQTIAPLFSFVCLWLEQACCWLFVAIHIPLSFRCCTFIRNARERFSADCIEIYYWATFGNLIVAS